MTFMNDISIPCSNGELLQQALTHKSYYFENRLVCVGDNEKLEFLGDAVLDLVVSEVLINHFPNESEGDLSQRRSGLVNEVVLSEIAKNLDLGSKILLGRGESASGGASKPRILASALEAVVGALFLSDGYQVAQSFVAPLFMARVEASPAEGLNPDDFKTRLQEHVQKKFKTTPIYEVVSEKGLDHEKTFTVEVKILEKVWGQGEGRSKKNAEQAAARVAWSEVQIGS